MGEVKVYSFIGQKRNGYDTNAYISGSDFAEQLAAADAAAEGEITVSINSGGGSVTHGWAMISAMQKTKNPVKAVIDGFAASMGYYICLGAKKITAAKNSIIMLHSVQGSAQGSPEDLRTEAEVLDKFNEAMATMLVERTGLTKEEVIAKYLGKELYLTAQEALDLKLIDAIEEYDAENIPAVEASMTLGQVEFKYAALHQETGRKNLIAEVVAQVKEFFAPKDEPKASISQEDKNFVLSVAEEVKCAADYSAAYASYIQDEKLKELLSEVNKQNSALLVQIVEAVYGEDVEPSSDVVTTEMDALQKNKQADIVAKAENAAAELVAKATAAKDEALASATQTIETLTARIAELETKPDNNGTVVVADPSAAKKPLTAAELDAKWKF